MKNGHATSSMIWEQWTDQIGACQWGRTRQKGGVWEREGESASTLRPQENKLKWAG